MHETWIHLTGVKMLLVLLLTMLYWHLLIWHHLASSINRQQHQATLTICFEEAVHSEQDYQHTSQLWDRSWSREFLCYRGTLKDSLEACCDTWKISCKIRCKKREGRGQQTRVRKVQGTCVTCTLRPLCARRGCKGRAKNRKINLWQGTTYKWMDGKRWNIQCVVYKWNRLYSIEKKLFVLTLTK